MSTTKEQSSNKKLSLIAIQKRSAIDSPARKKFKQTVPILTENAKTEDEEEEEEEKEDEKEEQNRNKQIT